MSIPNPSVEDKVENSAVSCISDLDGLANKFLGSFHACEKDFLHLGKALDGFNTTAVEVSRMATNLAGLTAGEEVGNASAKLSEYLEHFGRECETAAAVQDISDLDSIALVGAKLTESMSDFARLVKHLSMLGIATRIESARLGSQGLGFSTLADDVEKLAGKIASSSEKIISRAQELSAQCREAAASLANMDVARKSCSFSALEILEEHLNALDALTESSRKTSEEISEEASGMVRSVSEAVLSMQFHDIIRQQLEHVDEAIHETRVMAQEGPRSDSDHGITGWNELAAWMKSVLSLQESQLGNAADRFAEAMQTLKSSLGDIAERVRNMAAEAGAVASKGTGQGGVLAEIESEARRIIQSLNEFFSLRERMRTVMGAVAASIHDMSSSVAEIEEVGAEIELIALNASVKAAHTGEEGKALGVLASAIQKLSTDARGQTETIMGLLASVDSSSFVIEDKVHAHARDAVSENAMADLTNEVAGLKALGQRTGASAAAVQELASKLSAEIQDTLDSLDFHHKLIESMNDARQRLGEMVAGLSRALPPGVDMSHSPKLKEMLNRYTMEAERLVHESALGISSQAAAVSDEGEFGGNVELF